MACASRINFTRISTIGFHLLALLCLSFNSTSSSKAADAQKVSHEDLALDLHAFTGKKIWLKAEVSCAPEPLGCGLYPVGAGGIRRPIFIDTKHVETDIRRKLYVECQPRKGGCPVEVTGVVLPQFSAKHIDVLDIRILK